MDEDVSFMCYRGLLTNRLHGKAAEISVTTTKCIKYINSIHGMHILSIMYVGNGKALL